MLGGVALIATLASLIITDLLSDGFTIDGGVTWLLAAVIVWAAAVLAAFILPFLGLKKRLDERRDSGRLPPVAAGGAMSRPRVSLTVDGIRALSSTRLNAAIASR